jgi:hypothetical protein
LWGNANHIDAINTEGGSRKGFRAEPAIVTIAGDGNDIRGCIIEGNSPEHPAIAFQISGSFTWSHNWVELSAATDGVGCIFKDVELGQIDWMGLVPHQRASFVNCNSILIGGVNINGDWTTLSANIDLDEKSNVRIESVIARMDAGMLDDPRISIGSVYNKKGGYRVDLPPRGNPVSLMPAPGARGAGSWQARWDASQGAIRGSMRTESRTDSSPSRLRVDIADNPREQQLVVEVPLPVTDELVGTRCIVTWRIDGQPQALVAQNGREIPSRVMNSLTANPLPEPLKKGDKLLFYLPAKPGTYYISEVALYSNQMNN